MSQLILYEMFKLTDDFSWDLLWFTRGVGVGSNRTASFLSLEQNKCVWTADGPQRYSDL